MAAIGWCALSWGSYISMWENPRLAGLLRLQSEQFWEITGMVLGICQLTALLLDHRWARWTVAIFMGWWWFNIAFGIMSVDPSTRSIAAYLGYAGINVFCLFRLLRRYP